MLISELIEQSGLTKETIRSYEKQGFIALDQNSFGYPDDMDYSETVLHRLLLISRLKSMGFTSNEINTFLELKSDDDSCHSNVKHTLENKILLINEQMLKLALLKNRLTQSVISCINGDYEMEKQFVSVSAVN